MAICNYKIFTRKFSPQFYLIAGLLLAFVTAARANDPYKISEQVFDFGHVGIDYRIFHNFKLTNTGKKDIFVDSVDVLCDCSSVLFDKKILKPGDSVLFKLTFDTKDFYGPVNRKLNVFISIPEKRVLSFFYLAEVGQWKNGLKPNPFAVFMLPTHKQQTVKITNKVFESTKVELQNQNDNYFKIEIVKGEAKLQEVLELNLIPDNTLAKGTYLSNFTLKIITDDPENPAFLTIPVKIARF